MRTLDTVSRLGGDEFAILIEESGRVLDEAETVAERVLAIARPSRSIVDNQQSCSRPASGSPSAMCRALPRR